jgi:hypothetical protein
MRPRHRIPCRGPGGLPRSREARAVSGKGSPRPPRARERPGPHRGRRQPDLAAAPAGPPRDRPLRGRALRAPRPERPARPPRGQDTRAAFRGIGPCRSRGGAWAYGSLLPKPEGRAQRTALPLTLQAGHGERLSPDRAKGRPRPVTAPRRSAAAPRRPAAIPRPPRPPRPPGPPRPPRPPKPPKPPSPPRPPRRPLCPLPAVPDRGPGRGRPRQGPRRPPPPVPRRAPIPGGRPETGAPPPAGGPAERPVERPREPRGEPPAQEAPPAPRKNSCPPGPSSSIPAAGA